MLHARHDSLAIPDGSAADRAHGAQSSVCAIWALSEPGSPASFAPLRSFVSAFHSHVRMAHGPGWLPSSSGYLWWLAAAVALRLANVDSLLRVSSLTLC